MAFRNLRRVAALIVLLFCAAGPARAQLMDSGKPLGAAAQGELPGYLKDAGVVERLNHPLPLEAVFTDETGQRQPLAGSFHAHPVALALVYYRCLMLCPQVLHSLAAGLKASGFAAGKDYDVIVASIDPADTPADAAQAKHDFLQELGQPDAAGVHFLTGDPVSIAAIASATGFHYVKVPGPDGKMDQYAHSSVVMFATPEGKLSEYLSGLDYPSRDVRLALVNASSGKIASTRDLILMYCCNYVPAAGRYTVAVLRILGFAAMLATAGMILGLILLVRSGKATARPTAV